MMGKFEIGQRLRVLDNSGAPSSYEKGEVGVVEAVYRLDMIRLAGKSAGMFEHRFEPWAPKVGERVQFIRDSTAGGARFGAKDQLATVTNAPALVDHSGKPWVDVKLDNAEISFNPSTYVEDLAPAAAPATLTIEAGKFYETRDGRKVGPMKQREGFLEVEFFHYSTSGECCYLGQSGDDTHPKRDLIAEWVDEPKACNDNGGVASLIGKSVTVQIAKPKFKVGDVVRRSNNYSLGRLLRIKEVINDDNYTAEWTDGGPGSTHGWRAHEFELVTPTPTATAIVCLIENGQPKPSTTPHVHADETKAGKEAARLAGVYKGKEFGVFVLTTTSQQAAPVYKHEWQRQAAAGNKINAIKELREIASLDLLSAKKAVEVFIEKAA